MSLTIHKLNTRCRSPRGVERPGTLVDDVARGLLASELNAQLGASLDRLPAVIRLKDLRVTLRISSRNLNAAALASAWARAFTLAIHRALAYPPGDGAVSSRRYETEAAYKAALMHDIAIRGLAPHWEFPELDELRVCSPPEAALAVLLGDPRLSSEILGELSRRGRLELLLAFWDELSLERLMQAMAEIGGAPGLSLEDLIELARLAAASGALRPQLALAGRRQAISLWVQLRQRWPVREMWHGMRLLLKFLEMPAILLLRDPALLADAIPFPAWCERIVVGGERPVDFLNREGPYSERESGLLSVLDTIRPLVPTAANPIPSGRTGATITWMTSDCAGILLMLSVVRRLDLTRLIRKPEFARLGGVRALSFLLAGIGMTLLKRWTPAEPVEPAVAIFAGMLPEPDLSGLRQFFSSTEVSVIADFVRGETWAEALDHAAVELVRGFASRVRGFRKASHQAIVRQFIRLRGRILVEDARLLVVLEPSPFSVALHLSSMDDPLDGVEWLNQRRVDFVLEGL